MFASKTNPHFSTLPLYPIKSLDTTGGSRASKNNPIMMTFNAVINLWWWWCDRDINNGDRMIVISIMVGVISIMVGVILIMVGVIAMMVGVISMMVAEILASFRFYSGGQKCWDLSSDITKTSDSSPPTPNKVEFGAKWVKLSAFLATTLLGEVGGTMGWTQSRTKNCP